MGKEKSTNFLTLEEELECGKIIAKSRENPDDKALREKADEAINKLFIANEKGIYSIVHSSINGRTVYLIILKRKQSLTPY